jgi:hypothetical protein
MQAVLGSSCLIFETSLRSLDRSDMSSFLVVAWSMHPKLIPAEVGYAIQELVEPFVECAPPLFLRASKIIHSKCDTLQFQVFIRILEIHDFNIPSKLESDSSSEGDSSGEDYPDYNPGRGMLQPGRRSTISPLALLLPVIYGCRCQRWEGASWPMVMVRDVDIGCTKCLAMPVLACRHGASSCSYAMDLSAFWVQFDPLEQHGSGSQTQPKVTGCHTPVLTNRTEASICVPRIFKSHAWQQYDKQMKCYK